MSKKHEVNVKKDRTIDFQIGLIALLSFSYFMYGVFNYKDVPQKVSTINVPAIDPTDVFVSMGPVTPIPDNPIAETTTQPKEPKPAPKAKTISKGIPKVVEKVPETNIVEQPNESDSITNSTTELKTTSNNEVKTNVNSTTKGATGTNATTIYGSKTVEFLPIFPGCDKYSTNNQRAICFQEKVQRMVLRKFNNGLGQDLGLTGKQTIFLYFEVNEHGVVSNIKARSKSKELADEAERVARLLPKMQPARHGNTKVKMAYTLPITFKVR